MDKEKAWDELKQWLIRAVPKKYEESQSLGLCKSDSDYIAAIARGMDQVLMKMEDMERQ
jgi:hypothetical protein